MFSSLSAFRLRETASAFGKITYTETEFVVLRSNTLKPVTQYYIVPADWELEVPTAQIEPLAHVNITVEGKIILKTWQPEIFKCDKNKQSFLTKFQALLH